MSLVPSPRQLMTGKRWASRISVLLFLCSFSLGIAIITTANLQSVGCCLPAAMERSCDFTKLQPIRVTAASSHIGRYRWGNGVCKFSAQQFMSMKCRDNVYNFSAEAYSDGDNGRDDDGADDGSIGMLGFDFLTHNISSASQCQLTHMDVCSSAGTTWDLLVAIGSLFLVVALLIASCWIFVSCNTHWGECCERESITKWFSLFTFVVAIPLLIMSSVLLSRWPQNAVRIAEARGGKQCSNNNAGSRTSLRRRQVATTDLPRTRQVGATDKPLWRRDTFQTLASGSTGSSNNCDTPIVQMTCAVNNLSATNSHNSPFLLREEPVRLERSDRDSHWALLSLGVLISIVVMVASGGWAWWTHFVVVLPKEEGDDFSGSDAKIDVTTPHDNNNMDDVELKDTQEQA